MVDLAPVVGLVTSNATYTIDCRALSVGLSACANASLFAAQAAAAAKSMATSANCLSWSCITIILLHTPDEVRRYPTYLAFHRYYIFRCSNSSRNADRMV